VRAANKKEQLLKQFKIKTQNIKLDRNYVSEAASSNVNLEVPILGTCCTLTMSAFSHENITDLELQIRAQSDSEHWHRARSLHITS